MQVIISDNYAYKCYRYLGVKAETKHRVRYSPCLLYTSRCGTQSHHDQHQDKGLLLVNELHLLAHEERGYGSSYLTESH